jgi:arsenate reductase-like glutaredoxin family protein
VLALVRNSGTEPEIIEYLATPPTREKLVALIAQFESALSSTAPNPRCHTTAIEVT